MTDSNGDIYAMPADGSEPATDLTPGTTSTEAHARFSPDGTKIALTTNRDGNFNLYTMNPDGSDPQPITSSPALGSHPDFSPVGTQLTLASSRSGTLDIYNMKAAPEGAANVPVDVITNLAATNERFPVWSPNGTKIMFWSGISAGTGPDSEICVMNTPGSDQTNITHHNAGETTPDWGRAPTHKHRTHSRTRSHLECRGWRSSNWVDRLAAIDSACRRAMEAA
jgi:Tol biopolymer transport system component